MGLGEDIVVGVPSPLSGLCMVAIGLPFLWDCFYNPGRQAHNGHPKLFHSLPLEIIQGKNVTLGSSFSF